MRKLFLRQVIRNLQKEMSLFIRLKNSNVRVWKRSEIINLNHIFRRFEIHNGKNFYSILVTSNHIGKVFGSFSFSRKKVLHLIANKKVKKK